MQGSIPAERVCQGLAQLRVHRGLATPVENLVPRKLLAGPAEDQTAYQIVNFQRARGGITRLGRTNSIQTAWFGMYNTITINTAAAAINCCRISPVSTLARLVALLLKLKRTSNVAAARTAGPLPATRLDRRRSTSDALPVFGRFGPTLRRGSVATGRRQTQGRRPGERCSRPQTQDADHDPVEQREKPARPVLGCHLDQGRRRCRWLRVSADGGTLGTRTLVYTPGMSQHPPNPSHLPALDANPHT